MDKTFENKPIELLAPAKNKETAIAAINYGADAVYIGGLSFGARKSASNNIKDVEHVIKHAHFYNSKVFITINTLLNDEEIEQAQTLIHQLYNIGADAIIIQDMGLLECNLPPIAIHASTQCHNLNKQKIKFLENVGFKRAILARELSLEQIKSIRNHTNIELEAFIHGALCVSYSGQCYMSYAIGRRSGNKGECAQPCRKKYSLVDEYGNIISKPQHLLSLKDFNLSNNLKDLVNAGVSSFKIEGRLKDINYVKNVVAYYRQEIDRIIENTPYQKASSGKIFFDFIPNLNKTFNRGYCDYFFNGRKANITEFRTPKSLGEPIGKVISVKGNSFKVNTNKTFNNGDGICFFDIQGELKGTQINNVKGDLITPQTMDSIEKGTFIYRNYSHDFNKRLENSKTSRKINIKYELKEEDSNIIIKATDEDGVSTQISIINQFEQAKNEQKATENIKKQLSKLGETNFVSETVLFDLKQIPFIPIGEINSLRRKLIEKLEQKRIQVHKPSQLHRETIAAEYPVKELYYSSNVLNQKAKHFYEKHGAKVIEQAPESGLNMSSKKVMITRHCLKYSFNMCPKQNTNSSYENLYLIDEKDKKYKLEFDCKNCEMTVIC